MQLRAGKYGDDNIVIIYAETEKAGNNGYGNVEKGTVPKVFVIRVSDMQIIINDKIYNKLLMNTNEDLRTFRDGVLIWGAANKDGKLVINKIGTPLLDDSYEDIDETITKDDADEIEKKTKEETNKKEEENEESNVWMIFAIAEGAILGLILIIAIIHCCVRQCKLKKKKDDNYLFGASLINKNGISYF